MFDKILKSEIEIDFPFPDTQNVAQYVLDKINFYVKSGCGELECIGDTIINESFKYQDIEPLSYQVALWLTRHGFVKGDTVLYSSHNGAKLHIFLLGVWRLGGVVRSSYPEDHGDELIARIKESEVKWILCDEQYVENNLKAVKEVDWDINVIVSGNNAPLGCFSLNAIFETEDAQGFEIQAQFPTTLNDIALILQTSGTTGSSKGAVYTHEKLLKNIYIFQQLQFTDKIKEPFLLTSRLTHFTGSVIPLAFLASNRRIIINSKPTLDSILRDISKYKVRGLLAFPKFLQCIANDTETKNYDISSLKYVVTAGQVVGPSFINAVKMIPSLQSLYVIYGMTEIGLISVNADWTLSKALDEFPAFSCGRLAPGNELIVKDMDTGNSLGTREIGEFYFRSPYSCKGYFKQSKITQEMFQNDWVRTGDVGFYDENGFIYIKDRLKEIFKYFNNHICPSELENILLKHSNVTQACVVGVPDLDGGDTVPRAFVVLKNVDTDSTESLMQIQKFLNEKVASYKWLRGGIFKLKELPTGKTGKVLRSLLASLE